MRPLTALLITALGCTRAAPRPVVSSHGPPGGDRRDEGIHLGTDGLRGFEDGQPLARTALEVLLPGSRAYYNRGTSPNPYRKEWTVALGASKEPAMEIDESNVEVMGRRVVMVTSPAVRTSLGVDVGGKLGAAARLHRIRCVVRDANQLDCVVVGTRFQLEARGGEVDQLAGVGRNPAPRAADYPDHAIIKIYWRGPVRPPSLRKQPIERWTATRGGIGPIDRLSGTTAAQLAPRFPAGYGLRQRSTSNGHEITVEHDHAPFLRFVVREDELADAFIETPAIPSARGIRVGDKLATAIAVSPPLECFFETDTVPNHWLVYCSDQDIIFILGPYARPRPPAARADLLAGEPITAMLLWLQ